MDYQIGYMGGAQMPSPISVIKDPGNYFAANHSTVLPKFVKLSDTFKTNDHRKCDPFVARVTPQLPIGGRGVAGIKFGGLVVKTLVAAATGVSLPDSKTPPKAGQIFPHGFG